MADAKKLEEIDYLGSLLMHWKTILLGAFICAVAAVGVSLFLPNIYEASVVLIVAPPEFKTSLKPRAFPATIYEQILQNHGLLQQLLSRMKQKHPDDFTDVTVERLRKACSVTVETPEVSDGSAEARNRRETFLLILSCRNREPVYAMEMANIWAEEFLRLNERLQKLRTVETERFISEQFKKAKEKLLVAETEVISFKDEAQIEALKQRLGVVSEQAKALYAQLEAKKEELASEKQKLQLVEELIEAVEIDGRWLGDLTTEQIDISNLNEFQKRIASELLTVIKRYNKASEDLTSFKRRNDIEVMKQRLSSERGMMAENSRRLEQIALRRRSLEAALELLTEQLDKTKQLITLKKAFPEEVISEKLLEGSPKEEREKLAELSFASEILNPHYLLLREKLLSVRKELESIADEEKYLRESLPQLEERMRREDAELQRLQRRYGDLLLYYEKTKSQYHSRYTQYISWLNERDQRRKQIKRLNESIKRLTERYNERLRQMRTIGTDLETKKNRLMELRRDVDITQHAYELFKNKIEESRIAVAEETGDIRVVSNAIKPNDKVSPQRSLITVIAAIAGFLLSSLLVILREYRLRRLG